MNNIFFTSDTHYYHKKILELCPTTRKGDSLDEMHELMIQAHNDTVRRNDLVYFIGDFSFGTEQQTLNIVQRLNGQKHLVYGNHDKVIRNSAEIQQHFVSVQDVKNIYVNKQRVVLCHFPMRVWEQCHRGSFHLFGHAHGALDQQLHGRSMDVGIDTRPGDMKPWHWDEIVSRLQDRELIAHH